MPAASPAEYFTGILILLLLGIRLFLPLEQYMDIQFADEAAYMRFGFDLFEKLNRDWGPVYTIWYKLLSYITNDPVQLYYLNYQIAALAVPVLFFIFLLRLRIIPLLALFLALCFLYSNMNVTVWPRISNFCMMLFLASLILITFQRSVLHRILTMLFCCLICSYARPEFYLAFLAIGGLLALYLYFNRPTIRRQDIYLLVFAVLTIGILHIIFRFPSNNFFGFNRGVAAFFQHYAYNYKVRHHAPGVAWLFWEELAKKTFGDCNSMWCVIKTQPGIVIDNTIYNIQQYILFTWMYVSSFLIPAFLTRSTNKALLASLLVAALLIYCLVKRKRRRAIVLHIRQHLLLFLFLLVFCLPTFASCVVVYPRTHYILLQAGLTLTTLAVAINAALPRKRPTSLLMGLFLPFFLLLPSGLGNYNFLLTEGESVQRFCNVKIIETLRGEFSGKPYTLFTPMPFVTGMLPKNFSEVNSVFDKKTDTAFSYYLDKQNINIILVTPATDKDPHLLRDSSWLQFRRDPAAFGFTRRNVCDSTHYLLIQTN